LNETPLADRDRYAQLLEAVGDAVIAIDARCRVIEFNKEAERIFGYSKAEILGKSVNILLPKESQAVHGSHIALFSAEPVQRRQMRERAEVHGRRKDGSEFDAEVSIAKLESGGEPQFMAVVRDVSVRKRMERDLEESAQHLRQAQQLAGFGSWEHDVQSGKVTWSAQIYEIFGFDPNTQPPSSELFLSVVHPVDRVMLQDQFDEAVAARETVMATDIRIRRGDGAERVLHELSELVWGEDGRLLRQIGAFQDVTEQRAAAEQLRNSEHLLNRAQELADLGSWEHDEVTGDISWSRNFFRLLGLDPNIHRPSNELFLSIVHPDEYDKVEARYRKAIADRDRAATYDTRIKRSDGVERMLRNTVEYYWSTDDRLLRVTGISQDVTEQRAASEKLKQSEQSLANAQRIAHIGNWDWNIEDNTLSWSAEIYRIFGQRPEEFVPTYLAFLQLVHPDDRENLEAEAAAAVRRERPYDIHHRIILPSGSIRAVHEQGEMIFAADGKPLFMNGTVQDVTEKKKIADELERGERMLQDAERIAKIGSWEIDLATGEAIWSSGLCEMTGLSPTTGMPDFAQFLSVIHPDDRPMMQHLVEAALSGDDRQTSGDYRMIGADGRERMIYAEIRFVRDPAERLVRIVGTNRDVTEERAAEQALQAALSAAQQANQAKSEFLANMSHELRTPLNAIIGFSEILTSAALSPSMTDRDREYAGDIRDSGLHLLDIINDILDFSRLEAARTAIEDEPIETRSLLDWVVKLLEGKTQAKSLSLTVAVAPDAGQFRGDLRLLRQALLNILSNAVKFTLTGGMSLVAERTSNGGLAISVTDTGIGMRPEDIPSAMTPFIQLDNSLQRSHEGIGLGLPLAKRFVELHGGIFRVVSAPGKGTTVTIEIPAERCG